MLKSHFTRIVSHRRGRLLVGDQVNAHIKTLNFLIRYDIILIMINDVTHLSEELPGPGVEPDCLLHEVPRVLGVAHLLDLVLGGVDPEGGVCHVHLQHPAEGASYHVVPPLENRISFQNSRGTSDYVTYCTVDIVHELQVQHGFTHHSLEEVDVGEPNFDVRLEAVLENLVKLGDPPRHGVVDLLLLV